MADGQIQNSDLGFVLSYANDVPAGIIQATVEALQPYPRGLLTNVGMVVANAAYDSNTTNIEVGLPDPTLLYPLRCLRY